MGDDLGKPPVGTRELRKFGLLVGGVFAVIAGFWWWRGKAGYGYWLLPALPLLVLAVARPGALRRAHVAWMGLGLLLGWIVSTVLLTLFFYLAVTPLALLARCLGKDFLNRRRRGAQSYWIPRQRSGRPLSSRYEQQF